MSYGSVILKELIEEVKGMTSEEYDALYEESLKLKEVHIVLPEDRRPDSLKPLERS